MKTDDLVELQIESIAFGGSGVARVDNFVIFVPFCLAGEKVLAKILKIKSNYAEAMPVNILEPCAERINPKCRYFGRCGGCAYQNLKYDKQLELKTTQVKEVYKQITGKNLSSVKDICASPELWGYRSKIRLKYKKVKNQFIFGYFDHYNNRLMDIENCPIARASLNECLMEVRKNNFEFFRRQRIKAYNLAFLDSENGVIDNIGKNHEISISLLGKTFYYNRDSFFQINHSIFEALFQELFVVLKEHNVEFKTLLDIFCGVGFFGVILADKFDQVQFIEENKASCRFIHKNIIENNIDQKCQIICSSADKAISMISQMPEVVIMDPPRSGASEASIRQICSFSPKLVVYISCNPGTQFRDALAFEKHGYEMVYLRPFDFFPHTKHIETMALFKKT